MTQELLAVILEQKSYNTLKVPVFGALKQKIASGLASTGSLMILWERTRSR